MNPSAILASDRNARREWIAWAIWVGFCLAAVALLIFGPERHPVNESYAHGARCWEARAPLYDEDGCGFIYPPQAAILHWPFTRLPHPLYELIWRGVNLGLFAAGMQRLARCCEGQPLARRVEAEMPAPEKRRQLPPHGHPESSTVVSSQTLAPLSLFLVMTWLTLPKAWTLALNGQATTAMGGLMLLAVVDGAERRWWRATAALLLALAFKPLAIVLLLLIAGLFPPMLWRLSAGGLLFLAFPYLAQDAGYVTSQYAEFVRSLGVASALGRQMVWPGLFSLLHMIGLDVSVAGQTIVQLGAALLTLLAGWLVRRRFPPPQASVLLYALATCYLLLFNPRTENNGYTLLMPAVAAFAARALVLEKSRSRSILLVAIVVGLTCGFEITRVLTPRAAIVWICPLSCIVFLGFLLAEIGKPLAWNRIDPPRTANSPLIATGLACSP